VCFRGYQLGLPYLTESEDTENGFCLNGNPYLCPRIERTLYAAHVEVNLHVKSLPADLLSGNASGERRLTPTGQQRERSEPPPADHPIISASKELDNLLVTPQCAWTAREARQRLLDEAAENILAFTKGQDRNRIA